MKMLPFFSDSALEFYGLINLYDTVICGLRNYTVFIIIGIAMNGKTQSINMQLICIQEQLVV